MEKLLNILDVSFTTSLKEDRIFICIMVVVNPIASGMLSDESDTIPGHVPVRGTQLRS